MLQIGVQRSLSNLVYESGRQTCSLNYMETSNPKQSKRRTGILAFLVFIIYSLLIVLIFWPADPKRQRLTRVVAEYSKIEDRLKAGDNSALYDLLQRLKGPDFVPEARSIARRRLSGLEAVSEEALVNWMQDNIKSLEFDPDSKMFEIRVK